MKLSLTVQTKIGDWKIAQEAEALGYYAVWFGDTQMLWSDCYATMALAAQATAKIRLGTGVAVPGTRIAPVTAHSVASINQLAPGRTFLGIGTGHTAMRGMGMKPMPLSEFAEYVEVVRALLRGDEVDYTYRGQTRNIQFLHEGMGFRNTDDPIPIYIAANGPKALQVAGAHGDGLISVMGENPELLPFNLAMVKEGAAAAGRTWADNFHTASLSSVVMLRPGEKLTDERVIDAAASGAAMMLHASYELYQQSRSEEVVFPFLRGIWEEYCDYVEEMETPPDRRFRQIHEGHGTYCPLAERRFVTPEVIEGSHLVGTADELVEQIRVAEGMGLDEISLLPPMSLLRETMHEWAEVMRRL